MKETHAEIQNRTQITTTHKHSTTVCRRTGDAQYEERKGIIITWIEIEMEPTKTKKREMEEKLPRHKFLQGMGPETRSSDLLAPSCNVVFAYNFGLVDIFKGNLSKSNYLKHSNAIQNAKPWREATVKLKSLQAEWCLKTDQKLGCRR